MSDEEEDYLSDKFLAQLEAASKKTKPKTYTDLRKEAARISEQKNEAGRKKSRKQLEDEARQEGLNKSLFERAREEKEELGVESKALNMMKRMGFKVGESLGAKTTSPGPSTPSPKPPPDVDGDSSPKQDTVETVGTVEVVGESDGLSVFTPSAFAHRKTPIPLSVWSGRQGLGKGKRALSPTAEAEEKASKVAKLMAEEAASADTFRNRARQEFEERRAEGRLLTARKTCMTLDEETGKKFDKFWLNPHVPNDFPPSLREYIANNPEALVGAVDEAAAERLRWQMQRDALRFSPDPDSLPLSMGPGQARSIRDINIANNVQETEEIQLSDTEIQEALAYLRQDPMTRLEQLLTHLREMYNYCFWCGTRYSNAEELGKECPGTEEDDHD
ncbi:hypothetical protein DACRYDRAFT_102318 [Dacryopinax primogenitus]|uniref:DUF4187 domain-containing protein n=1 Tax=Dacryopinax primogenitus (strain DJM 731) TaxID=1858805 RepID=M5FNK7_DACPD|nr:uncharacterized protein DACRYDRAFT_102318 [Dacryopinax primogenitus]EJT97615.1 hypothetical protein DACRYDRAFT_102318 [Dacryopinax primogenitus]